MKRSTAAAWSFLMNNGLTTGGYLPSQPTEETETKKHRVQTLEGGRQTNREPLCFHNGAKLVICMVGKPARKTRIAGKVSRYLSWLGYKVKLIKVSEYRKELVGTVEDDFFNPARKDYDDIKRIYHENALNDAIAYLKTEGQVAIYDSANHTKHDRDNFLARLTQEFGPPETFAHYNSSYSPMSPRLKYRLLWIESYCEIEEIVTANFLNSDRKIRHDYVHLSDEEALSMFWKKVKHFDVGYQSVDDEDDQRPEEEMARCNAFIKITDFGRRLLTQHIQGYLETRLATFCTNLHTRHRAIILATHGESEFNLDQRIGGNPSLTERGREFAKNLAAFIAEQRKNNFGMRESSKQKRDMLVWTSTSERTIRTGRAVDGQITSWLSLAEIDAGTVESMRVADFKEKMCMQYSQRQRDKLNWRYPHGESYVDVKKRLQNVLFELERQKNDVLIVSHRPVLRCLYSYFIDYEAERMPHLPFKLHTVIVLTPSLLGWEEKRVKLPPLNAEDKQFLELT